MSAQPAEMTRPWQADIMNHINGLDASNKTHAVVHRPASGGPAYIVDQGLAGSEAEAHVVAEDAAAKLQSGEEVSIVKLSTLYDWASRNPGWSDEAQDVGEKLRQTHAQQEESETPVEDIPGVAHIGRDAVGLPLPGPEVEGGQETEPDEEDAQALADAQAADLENRNPAPAANAEKGELFDGKEFKVKLDPAKPTVARLAISGSIILDLTAKDDVELLNRLKHGQTVELTTSFHIAGDKKVHRRDSEGDVDAVVLTRSLIAHSIDV